MRNIKIPYEGELQIYSLQFNSTTQDGKNGPLIQTLTSLHKNATSSLNRICPRPILLQASATEGT